MTRAFVRVSVLSMVWLAVAVPASAQVVHSLNFGVGVFTPRSFDSRVAGDVLVQNLTRPELASLPGRTDSLDFDLDLFAPHDGDIRKFRSAPVFAEWNIGIGRHVEFGLGLSYSNRKITSLYRDILDGHGTITEADDTEILQDLRLRMVPISGVVRFVFGPQTGVQGYIGGGVSAVIYKYSEVGQFVDPGDLTVFNGNFVATGTAVGGVLLGGLRFGLGGDVYALTLEGRYQRATGKTSGAPDFVGDKLDLGGSTINFGFLIRY